ncbi:hypothetical protein LJB97_01385 [Parabacteroides sp. OttesenSCG-928-O15]|nr:hypothetical protein [Parabacteroides sp. OttesenSCG-928-O15]
MKKLMLALCAVAVLFTACEDDDKNKTENGVKLAKTEETVKAEASEVKVDATSEADWWIDGVSVQIGEEKAEYIENTAKADTFDGDWFRAIRQEDGKALVLQTIPNDGEERKLAVAVTSSDEAAPVEFVLTQEAKEEETEEK